MNNLIIIDNQSIVMETNCGYKFLIDKEDFDLVRRFTWHKDYLGYLHANVKNKKKIKLHRFIMNPHNDVLIDHINHLPWDNRKSNLRISNKSLNGINRNESKNRSNTGYLGVSLCRGLFVARISQTINKKRIVHYFSSTELLKSVEWIRKKRKEILNG